MGIPSEITTAAVTSGYVVTGDLCVDIAMQYENADSIPPSRLHELPLLGGGLIGSHPHPFMYSSPAPGLPFHLQSSIL